MSWLFDKQDNPNGESKDGNLFKGQSAASERRSSTHLWLISYSDFMTILMIFFLAMYGYTYLAKEAIMDVTAARISYTEFTEMMHNLKGDLSDKIEIKEDLKKITIELPEDILFASGKANLAPQAQTTLEELAKSIKLVSGAIVVEGHTDNVPISKGPYPSNWELSAARAFSVIEALTQNGVSADRLSAWGFGKHRPVASNDTAANKAKNRRIGIVLLKVEDEPKKEV